LKIKENTEENENHYKTLIGLIEEIKTYDTNMIPLKLIEDFGGYLLRTPELISEINKLIFKNYS